MLLDDLLKDAPTMRRLVGLIRHHSRPSYEAQLHESFLDHAALQEELFTRLHMQRVKTAGASEADHSTTGRSRDHATSV